MKVDRELLGNAVIALLLAMFLSGAAASQERGIKPDEFIKARPIQKNIKNAVS